MPAGLRPKVITKSAGLVYVITTKKENIISPWASSFDSYFKLNQPPQPQQNEGSSTFVHAADDYKYACEDPSSSWCFDCEVNQHKQIIKSEEIAPFKIKLTISAA